MANDSNSGRASTVSREEDVNVRLKELAKERGKDTAAGRALASISSGELGWGAAGAGSLGLLTWLLTGGRKGMGLLDRSLVTAGASGLGFLGGMSLPSYLKDSGTGLSMADRMRLAGLVSTTSKDDAITRTAGPDDRANDARTEPAPDRGIFDTVSDWIGRSRASRTDALSGSNIGVGAATVTTGALTARLLRKRRERALRARLDPASGLAYQGLPDIRAAAEAEWQANPIRRTVERRNAALEALVESYDRRARQVAKAAGQPPLLFGDLSTPHQAALVRSWHLPGGGKVLDGGAVPLTLVGGTMKDRKGNVRSTLWVDVDPSGPGYSRSAMENINGVDRRTGRLDGNAWVSARESAVRGARQERLDRALSRSKWLSRGAGVVAGAGARLLGNVLLDQFDDAYPDVSRETP